jgi:hypothetical protein
MNNKLALLLIILLASFGFSTIAFQSFPKIITLRPQSNTVDPLSASGCSMSPQEPASGGGGQGVT